MEHSIRGLLELNANLMLPGRIWLTKISQLRGAHLEHLTNQVSPPSAARQSLDYCTARTLTIHAHPPAMHPTLGRVIFRRKRCRGGSR